MISNDSAWPPIFRTLNHDQYNLPYRPRHRQPHPAEYACVSLASASVMASDFARDLKGSQGHTLLGIQQSIMLGEMAVNRVLDNLDPP